MGLMLLRHDNILKSLWIFLWMFKPCGELLDESILIQIIRTMFLDGLSHKPKVSLDTFLGVATHDIDTYRRALPKGSLVSTFVLVWTSKTGRVKINLRSSAEVAESNRALTGCTTLPSQCPTL